MLKQKKYRKYPRCLNQDTMKEVLMQLFKNSGINNSFVRAFGPLATEL